MTAKIIPLRLPDTLSADAMELERNHKAGLTLDAYKRYRERFQDFVLENHLSLNAVAFAEFLTALHKAGYKFNTITGFYSGVVDWLPELKTIQIEHIMGGIRRAHADNGPDNTKALVLADAERIISCLGDSLTDCRDRAMLAVGWSTASRKAELLSLNVDQIVRDFDGCWIEVQEKRRVTKRRKLIPGAVGDMTVPLAPTTYLARWIKRSGITSGPLWRKINKAGKVQDQRLSRSGFDSIFKRLLKTAGLDPSLYSAHSMRAGFITHAVKEGHTMASILAVTGHKSVQSLQPYFDEREMVALHPLKNGGESKK